MTEPYIDRPLMDFLADAAADKPTPGGGAVAALCGALASTMGSMAANFTAGREPFADVQDEIQAVLGTLSSARQELLEQVEADIAGYARVGAAYGMPRKTADQKAARKQAIQLALQAATGPPDLTADSCLAVLSACGELVDLCNPNLLSDVGVAAVLAEAALRAAQINVRVNLAGIDDAALVARQREKLAADGRRAKELAAKVAAAIDRKM
jgi:formiminotetrahydrofolate cyclodeaminase